MSTPDKDTVETVEKLLVERRKVTGWLDALAARRAETSSVVYQRVHDDYAAKLDKVQAKLVAASDAVQAVAADVAARLTDKEEAVAVKRDERAEAELRAAVGEFSEREWEKRRTRLDEEIGAVTAERDALRDELARLRTVLDEVAASGAPADAIEEAVAPPAAEPAMPEPLAESAVPAGEAVGASSAPTPVVPAEAIVPTPPVIPIHEQSPIAPAEPAAPLAPSFDELAFLKSVVGRQTPPLARPAAAASEPAAAVPEPPAREDPIPRRDSMGYIVPEPPTPFPDPVPEPRVSQEMTPPRESFFGRPTPRTSEAVKSLRCQECGTLNYPTEWYCERCGGELAAL